MKLEPFLLVPTELDLCIGTPLGLLKSFSASASSSSKLSKSMTGGSMLYST